MKRIISLDIIRIFAFVCILIIHFNASICGYEKTGSFSYNNSYIPSIYHNAYLGDIGSILFFMISGAGLFYSSGYISLSKLKSFYRKRFKSIYPMYWISLVFIALLFHKQIGSSSDIFASIMNLLGLSGYILAGGGLGIIDSSLGKFYMNGEWFLGAILLLYICYPFFVRLFQISKVLAFILAILLNILIYFDISNVNFFVYFLSLYIGMLIVFCIKNNSYRYIFYLMLLFVFCASICEIINSKLFSIKSNTWALLYASTIFCLIVLIFNNIQLSERITSALVFISKISFPAFLIHHHFASFFGIGYDIVNLNLNQYVVLLILYLSAVYLCSYFLLSFMNYLKKVFSMLKSHVTRIHHQV